MYVSPIVRAKVTAWLDDGPFQTRVKSAAVDYFCQYYLWLLVVHLEAGFKFWTRLHSMALRKDIEAITASFRDYDSVTLRSLTEASFCEGTA